MLNAVPLAKFQYKIALYLRISHEDDTKDESNSIKNQREIIKKYISEQPEFQDAELIDYADDGISGSHTDRAAYQRLMTDIRNGAINCIIVKDLSRIGRNMLDVDDLLMNSLVTLSVRFIAVNNFYDSLSHPLSNLELAIINLANEHYNKDLVIKSKSAILVKQKRGEYLGMPPFGYKKSKTVKNKLVPDDEAAGYVRLIFSLAAEGRRVMEIARILNAQGIPSPAVYLINKGHKNRWPQMIDPEYCFWTNGVLHKLIRNEVYIGKVISNRFQATGTGRGHTVPRPKNEWIVVPGAHEPIVSESDFQKAQLVLPRPKYDHEPDNVFGKKVRCPYCGHAMRRFTKQNPRYKCGTASLTAHYGCRNYSILQKEIETAVTASIRTYAATLIDRKHVKLISFDYEKLSVGALETKIRDENKAIEILESSVTKLFTTFVSGKITQEVFQQKKAVVNETLSRKRRNIEQLSERLKTLTSGRVAVDNAVSELTPLLEIESLNKDIVELLIDKILVHGEKNIEIVWNGNQSL
jgi:DNA invertase Pin-like site-specific DNA recombinase